ncbi:MAG: hypothetical protein PHO10_00550 [Gemmiger sp.]|nr:hypothetical protein [Gemmiger sp.]
MGLFSRNFNTPGPGVSENEPRKKGLARLLEVLGRDAWPFFKAGFLVFLSAIPFLFGITLAVSAHVVLFALLAGLIGGMLIGPQLTGLADTILRSLRDEPGYWWQTYKRAWKRNAVASLLPGAICGLVFAVQIFTVYHLTEMNLGAATWVILLLGMLLSLGLCNYIWPQLALLELPFFGVLKNTALLFLGYLPRSAGAMAVQAVYWGVVLLYFPLSSLLLPLTGFWVPMLLSTLIVYPALDKSFDIEKSIKKIREAQMSPAPLPTTPAEPGKTDTSEE